MRPPEHWHLRRPPKRRPWPLIAVIASGVLVAVLLAVVCRAGGGDPDANVAAPVDCTAEVVCTPTPAAAAYGSDSPPPPVRGLAATVIEASCGKALYEKNADAHLPPASLTKMMTALIAQRQADLNQVVDVDVNGALMVASTGASIMGLEPGMRLSLLDLMYGMMLPSGNDAAIQIARTVGGTEEAFVDMMNAEAQRLGMFDTSFSNPDGLDQVDLYSTAHDMALLGRAYMRVPELAEIARAPRYQPNWDRGEVLNGNELLERYQGAIGVKTGYTELAGQTIVAAAQRGSRVLIVAVLGSYNRYADATSLFDWAFSSTRPACD
ncbi:MAG TPA: D-alanyl-D-alanine carboxypeptidase family protein [Dehalococcoidia bacterium]